MMTLFDGETTEVPEQRPNPIPAPSEMKMTPLTRYPGAVGSAIVSEVAVSVGLRVEACAAGPSIGRAASIRAGVQNRRAAASSAAIEIEGVDRAAAGPWSGPAGGPPHAPAAGASSAPATNAPARASEIEGHGRRMERGLKQTGRRRWCPFAVGAEIGPRRGRG